MDRTGKSTASQRPAQALPATRSSGINRLEGLKALLAAPVSGASLAACRIALGLVTVLEVYSLCRPSKIVSGKIPALIYFVGPGIHFNFPYPGFEWLPLLPAPWFYGLLALMALSGVLMVLGLFYRAAAAVAFLTSGYLFAVESTRTYYQSYYYIELLVTFLMMWMPAARRFSLDAWLGRNKGLPRTIPFWPVFLLRGQLVLMYFYGGVAKLNADWLLDAAPLRWVLREPHVGEVFKPFLSAAHFASVKAFLQSVPLAYFLSYAGVLFDLSVGFLLLARRTRALGLVFMAIFHATNGLLIYDNIDWFPLVGLSTALIFLEPDWPERFWKWLRQPRFIKPDWGWLIGGAILIPGAGAALGWKSKPSPAPAPPAGSNQLPRFTLVFIGGYLAWQFLLPLRHYFIPGDARITYEGLSFSWRLKTDEHDAVAAQIFVNDSKIITSAHGEPGRIDWGAWHGDRVIYRLAEPARIDWQNLPEIVPLLEPLIGERVVYNPYSGSTTPRTESESQARIKVIWEQLYGRQPARIGVTTSLLPVLQHLSGSLKAGGNDQEAAQLDQILSPAKAAGRGIDRARLVAFLTALCARDETGGVMSVLRLTSPFAFDGGRAPGPFLVIDDPSLVEASREHLFKLDPKLWKNGPATRVPGNQAAGAIEPLVIYTGNIGTEAEFMLPQAYVFDSLDNPERPPSIIWNTLKDMSMARLTHVSNQPFYLRRYARRVAGEWEKLYGRRPAVTARTAVSMNHRPAQSIVDPNADLASVSTAWFGHNPWVNDLETPRIPAAALRGQTAP